MDHGDGVVDKVVRSLNQTLPGEMVHYRTTAPYTHANQTAVREAESAYRMVILTLGKVAEAVCMRVDPSIDDEDLSNIAQTPDSDGDGGSDDSLDDSSGSGDNSSNSGGDGDDNNKGGESAAGPQFPATMGSVAIAGLAAALFGLL